MNRFLKLFFFFSFLYLSVYAQSSKDYLIHLQAGSVLLPENSKTITKEDSVFTRQLSGNFYYLIIQFYQLPDAEEKNKLASAGIILKDYLPYNAYTAIVLKDVSIDIFKRAGIRSIGNLSADQKSSEGIRERKVPTHASKQYGMVDLTVITFDKTEASALQSALSSMNGTVLASYDMFKSFTVRVPQNLYSRVADIPFVQWVEFTDPPNELENLPGRTLHRVNVLQEGIRNLNGDGINIGIWDGGALVSHADFLPAGRVTNIENVGTIQHASHCAGTLAGKGILNPNAKGMAPNARLFSWDFNGNIQSEMATGIPGNNLAVSSHSYGFSFSGSCAITNSLLAYNSISVNTDINLNNFPTHFHVHSSGNSQGNCSGTGGYFTITGSGKSAKNILVVGNITSTELLSGSSSLGPVHDGRLKPEIVSMGTSVLSTSTPTNTYATLTGTSMATPGVAGTAALLYQRYKQLNGNNNPASALIKNIICNTARDLGNPGPDYKFGYGRIDALNAVRILEENRYTSNTVATGTSREFSINIPSGANKLKVMITWNDPAGTPNAAIALVNNLDLMVFKGTDTTRSWKLDKTNPSFNATKGKDSVNNIEQVVIDNPTGTYTVRVEGISVPSGTNQQYYLSWEIETPSIEVLYPNGNETFSPGNVETITWNNAGLTGNQTIEYSLDNGVTWIVATSTVPPGTTRFTWTVPSANTSTALIRISSGSITDVSNSAFHILGAVTGFSVLANCNSGELSLGWNATPNASGYDVMKLNTSTAQWEVIANNISATTYKLTGLSPLSSEWYAVTARNNTSGSKGPRSNGIQGTVSIAGTGISTINGTNLTCVGSANNSYTIPVATGASSYTWTIPSGASIATGQGTNSIKVDFPDGSTSGSVTVVANDIRGCSSNPSTKTITLNPRPAKPTISWNGSFLSTNSGMSAYTWYLNNTVIADATSSSLSPSSEGLYKVEIVNGNGCTNLSDEFNLVLTSLNEIVVDGSSVSIFPNPVKGQITFNVIQQSIQKLEVTIISADGRLMKQTAITNGVSKVDVSRLPAGSYFVRIKSKHAARTVKIQVVE